MLWQKAWLDTRWRFLSGLAGLCLLTVGTVIEYHQVMELLPAVSAPEGNGAIARAVRDSLELSRTFRGYVWKNAFAQNLSQLSTLFAILLASGGLRTEGKGTLFTLSLPVTRRTLTLTRAISGLVELFALTFIPSLLIVVLAPAVGEHYSLVDAFVHSALLFVTASLFYALTFMFAASFDDVWRPGLTTALIAVALLCAEVLITPLSSYGLFHFMTGESYFRGTGIHWFMFPIIAVLTLLMLQRAVTLIERRDF